MVTSRCEVRLIWYFMAAKSPNMVWTTCRRGNPYPENVQPFSHTYQ